MPFLCVFGCKNPGAALHVFPNPQKYPDRFKEWASIVGAKLETLTEVEVYKKKRICDIHFLPEHKNRNNRLSILAVPSLNLPDNNIHLSEIISSEQPPTSTSAVPVDTIDNNIHLSEIISSEQPPTSTSAVPVDTIVQCRKIGAKASASIVLQDHNYFVKRPKRTAKRAIGCHGGVYQHKVKHLQHTIYRLRHKNRTFKERLASAQKMNDNVAFNFVTKHMTKAAQLFTHLQLQAKKKPKGRRFTIEEKILSLTLYKKSPKCYRLLSKLFALPSTKTMKNLLSKIKLVPGINSIIFQQLKKTLEGKDASDRLCSLIFDEMSITAHINYNATKDVLEGISASTKNIFFNHVLVFMVKGLKKNFKQPIAYYYTNSLKSIDLKSMIKIVIKHALEAGLIIVNTVCDQSTVNVAAITELINDTKALFLRNGKEWREDIFRVNGKNIIPLYDIPHIIKGLRNNLLTKNLTYISNDVKKYIKWEYYQMVYAADKTYGELRLLDKITEEHINPEKINKMRVKSATQIFSHSVAVVTEHLTARGDLPEECKQLIEFTLLIDNLFDSLNVSTFFVPNGKLFKGPVKNNSPHHQLWQKAKHILKTVRFVKQTRVGGNISETEVIVPSITNLIKTIDGIQSLWKVLSNRYGFDAMLTRNFNQDPVENFFGNIRSFGGRNVSPNTVSFEGAYKALLLNGFNAPHSRRANCEADGSECLQTLDFFLRGDFVTTDVPEAIESNDQNEINFNPELGDSIESDAGQRNYVCGWVVKKCLKIIKCQHCRKDLIDDTSTNKNNTFLQRKEYCNKKWLCYPNVLVEEYFKELQSTAVSCLKRNVQRTSVKGTIIAYSELFTECPFKCELHKDKLKQIFVDTTLNVIIYSWCRSINRILEGKIKYDGEDEIKIAAQNYYNKNKNYKNKK